MSDTQVADRPAEPQEPATEPGGCVFSAVYDDDEKRERRVKPKPVMRQRWVVRR